uniref:Uncharacterized protein n=1 Tax=Opuntia streptacantha TaxID=393608 RepID=A0A7C9DZE9_OPUST
MLRFKRLTQQLFTANARQSASSFRRVLRNEDHLSFSRFSHPSQATSVRFLDIYQLGNKEAIEKERARLKDEMSRGYFADMSDLKKHGGKIAMANKVLVPATTAVKFPTLEVSYSDGKIIKLPVGLDGNAGDASKLDLPKATLLCLSFRASSQVSFIDSWLLSWSPVKRLLLGMMKKSNPSDMKDALQMQFVYSFGDHYYFRKELKILNLLTAYMFLLDKFGRIRWQGFGTATQEEASSLLSCTSALLEEK